MNDVIKFKGVREATALYNNCEATKGQNYRRYVRIYVDVKKYRVWAYEFSSPNSWNKYDNQNIHEFDFNVIYMFDRELIFEIDDYFEQHPRRKYNCNIMNRLLTSFVNNYEKMY